MHDDPHGFDHSVRDGIVDGSADDGHGGYPPYPRSRDRHEYRRYHHDVSGAPSWVKVLLWTGALLAVAGMGVIVFGLLDGPEPVSTPLTPAFPTAELPPGFPAEALPPAGFPGQPSPPSVGGPNLAPGFGLFFVGFVLTAIGALGHSTSRRR
ncbi:hypothetical protein ACFWN2_38235 [Lentzea sp. NPDC058436]|uniref:hypothetical protein n=1 Tax=Lentzea sp. NPDC058436 TaxID=3346499 RepID=UPI003654B498